MLPNVDTRYHNVIVIALEFVLTMEILMTNKNNEMLVHDAYAYFKYHILIKSWISLRCDLSKCNGRARFFLENVTISHFPDPVDTEKLNLGTAFKTRAVVADEPPRQVKGAAATSNYKSKSISFSKLILQSNDFQ